jgi:hypothetical protein
MMFFLEFLKLIEAPVQAGQAKIPSMSQSIAAVVERVPRFRAFANRGPTRPSSAQLRDQASCMPGELHSLRMTRTGAEPVARRILLLNIEGAKNRLPFAHRAGVPK